MKKVLTSVLALLLVLGTLLSLCGILSACKKEPTDDPVDTPTTPEETVQPTCSHAVTQLTNVRETSCARAGYTGDTVCTACGAVVQSGQTIPALPHTMDAGLLTKLSTCIDHGVTTFTCRECGWKNNTTMELVAHQDIFHDANDSHTHTHTCATCTINNYEEHVPKDAGIHYDATCTEPSYTLHTCKDCEGVYKVWDSDDTILGHNWPKDADNKEVWQITEPTCCATGLKSRECLRCGEEESMTLKVAPNAHNYVEFARDNATCVAKGTIYYECQNAGCSAETTKEIPVNPNAHNMTAETTPDGWTTDACQNIGCTHKVKTYTAPADKKEASVTTESIADSVAEERTFEVKTSDASVQFPTEVISQMVSNNSEKVDIQAGVADADDKDTLLAAATNLDAAQKERLENVDIFNFSVSGITGNFNAAVTVTIPYTLKQIEGTNDYEDPNGIQIWYVKTDGSGIDCFENVVFVPNEGSTTEGYVTFTTNHFSYYAVAYEETQEAKCRRGVHRWLPTTEDDKVAPTCTDYGYTVKECDTCHAIIYDDLVDKNNHDYSDPVDPVLSCTEGGYVVKICRNEGCGHTVNIEYRTPLGHTLSGAATCTEDSVCTRCSNIITPAHGHEWGDWITVFEPTATKSGLRRKNCPKCGAIEDAKLAATGTVQPVSFESYEDMMETMLETVLAFHNGKMTMVVGAEDDSSTITMDIKVKEEGESYLMLIDITQNSVVVTESTSQITGETTRTEYPYENYIQFMYRNGVTVLTDKRVSTHPSSMFNRDTQDIYTDLESAFMLPYELMLNYAKQNFDLYAPTVEGSLQNIPTVLRMADALAGSAVNDILKEIGSTYTLGSLADLYDKTQTVYTYLALTLGFGTTMDLGDVTIPTANDFMTVIGGFSNVTTDAAGNKTYTIDCAARQAELKAILGWIEAHENSSLASVVWTLLGKEVQTYYPDVTDWNAFLNKMKSTYTGTMLVKDAFNTAVNMLERKGICTMQELYDLMGTFLSQNGEPVDVEKMISENWNFTLNELVSEMGMNDLDAFYTQMNQYLTTAKLGELVVGYRYEYNDPIRPSNGTRVDVTLTERVADIKDQLNRNTVTGNFSFTLDAEGRLLDINIDMDVDYTAVDEEDDMVGGEITLKLERDDNIVIELPANLQPVSNIKLQSVFDNDGNMLITVPEGFEYTFETGGYGEIALSELIEKDEEMSEKLGVTVYVLKSAYWDQTVEVGEYILYNNKYYTWKHTSDVVSESYRKIVKEATLAQIVADPTTALTDATSYAPGYLNGNQVTLYNTLLGRYAFQQNGTWYLVKSSEHNWNNQLQNYATNITSYVALSDAIADMRLSSMESWGNSVKNEDGDPILVHNTNLSLNVTAWGTETVSTYAYLNNNGDLVLTYCEQINTVYDYYYMLTEEIPASALPDYDETEIWEERLDSDSDLRDLQGNPITEDLDSIELYRKVPTYYVKVNNNTYAGFTYEYDFITAEGVELVASLPSWIKTDFNEASSQKTVNLPDGNKLFVTGEKPYHGEGAKGEYDNIAYGWAKTNGIYVQAVARYCEGKLIEVVYRSDYSSKSDVALSERTLSFNKYIDLTQYLTKTGDNTYRLSASFFTRMQALCPDAGDSYWLRVIGKQTVSGVEYEFEGAVGLYEKARTIALNNRGDRNESSADWYDLFDSNRNGAMFSIIPGSLTGDASSITVRLNNGDSIDISYSCDNGLYPVTDGIIPKNDAKSEETGLPIYSAVTGHDTNTYVYQGGKYYYYSTYPTYDSIQYTTLDSIKQSIANDWFLSELSYKFDFTDQSNGTTYPVYEAEFDFASDNAYSSYDLSRMYVLIKEGQLYVLSGAVMVSESLLQFEAMVSPADYFAAAAARIEVVEDVSGWSYNTIMVNGQQIHVNYRSILYFNDYKEDDGEIACTNYISVPYVLENGAPRYVANVGDYLGRTLIKGTDPVTISNMIGTPELEEEQYYNGTFTFADVKRADYRYYVKLAGEYYHYDSYYFETYSGYCYDQDGYENAIASEKDHYYGVRDASGNWSYYNRMTTTWDWMTETEYAVLSEPITVLPTFSQTPETVELPLMTKNGETVTEFSGLVMGTILTKRRSDGTVFYHKEGTNNGFLKLANSNKYFRARMVVNQKSGATRILCSGLGVATLDWREIEYLDPLGKYLTVSADASSIKISKDILKAIPESVRDSFRLTLERNDNDYGYGHVTLTYVQLEAWFELTEIKDCNSGNFNGFVDYDQIYGEFDYGVIGKNEIIFKD